MEKVRSESIKRKIQEIIFEADTFGGKLFDILLLIAIVSSIIVVMLESVEPINIKYGVAFNVFEWVVTILFTIEYILRVYATGKPLKYVFSFYGIIDFLAFAPTYLMPLFPQSQYFFVARALRLLRIFRILKLVRYVKGSRTLISALRESRGKIVVFLTSVFVLVIIMGTLMYLIEHGTHGFTSIPRSIYWAIVTLTTVGYGDIVPYTTLGKFVASLIMILGYGIIAVPTGIVSAELTRSKKQREQLKNQSEILEKENEIISKETEILEKLKAIENKLEKLGK